MRLFDTSCYRTGQETDNYIIEVLPVNKTVWINFNVARGFSLTLNSSNLRYKKATGEDQLIDLPDGIYEIKQSFKPNISTVKHYYHLRTTDLSNKIAKEGYKLFSDKCLISRQEYIVNRDKLRDMDEYLKGAKWMVEEEHDRKKGKELYEFVKKLLEQYTNECGC